MNRMILSLLVCVLLLAVGASASPVLTAIADQTVTEGRTLTVAIVSTAGDNGTNTFSAIINPSSGTPTVTKNSETSATFTWTAPYVVANTVYTVTVNATDGNSTNTTQFNITVINLGSGPIIVPIADQSVNEGNTITFSVICSLPDASATTWSHTGVGTLTKINDTHATYSYTAPYVNANTPNTVVVTCQDSDSSSSDTFVLTVLDTISGLDMSNLAFGGSSQTKSNSETDEYVTTTSTFSVTNNQGSVMTNVQIIWNTNSKYNLTYVSISSGSVTTISNGIVIASIPAGATVTVTLRSSVPEDQDAFFPSATDPQNDRAETIGQLTATAVGGYTASSSVSMEVENMLRIDRLYIKAGTGSEKRTDNLDEVEDVEPGMKIEVKVRAKNAFSKSEEVQMEDLEFSVYADDDYFEVDESKDVRRLKESETQEIIVSFTVDSDVDEDTYTAYITLEAEDELGAIHGEQWKIYFEVEKEDEKIVFRRSELLYPTVSLCEDQFKKSNTLTVRIKNEGKDDSDEIVLVARNKIIGFYSKVENIDLEEGDDYSRTMPMTIPADTKAGRYQIDMYVYWDYDDFTKENVHSYSYVDLVIEECKDSTSSSDSEGSSGSNSGSSSSKDTKEEVEVIIVDTEGTTGSTGSSTSGGVTAVPTKTESKGVSTIYIVLLVVGIIFVLGAIIILLNMLSK
jgi:hypothetical protein